MRGGLVVAALLVATASVGCASTEERPTGSTVPAAKSTCPELVVVGQENLRLVDRVLIPYSRTILGVEATYEDDQGRTLMLISGGYLDDITEPYDSLEPAGTLRLGDATADVLVGTFFETPIAVAYSLRPDPPCGTIAVVGIGYTRDELAAVTSDLALVER